MEGVPLDDFSKLLSFNAKNLEAAGLLKFVQLPRPSRFYKEDMVASFMQTMSEDINNYTVELKGCKLLITKQVIADIFGIPRTVGAAPINPKQMLSNKVLNQIFPDCAENYDPETDLWDFSTTTKHWADWFSFINRYMCSEHHAASLSPLLVRMSYMAWCGTRLDWAAVLFINFFREVLAAKKGELVLTNPSKNIITYFCEQVMRLKIMTPIVALHGDASSSRRKEKVLEESTPSGTLKQDLVLPVVEGETQNAKAKRSKKTPVANSLPQDVTQQIANEVSCMMLQHQLPSPTTIDKEKERVMTLKKENQELRDQNRTIMNSNKRLGERNSVLMEMTSLLKEQNGKDTKMSTNQKEYIGKLLKDQELHQLVLAQKEEELQCYQQEMEKMRMQLAEYAASAIPSKVKVHDQGVQTIEVESTSSPTSTVLTKASMNVDILDLDYLSRDWKSYLRKACDI